MGYFKPNPPVDEYAVVASCSNGEYYGTIQWLEIPIAEGMCRKDAAELAGILLRSPKFTRVELRQKDAGTRWVEEEVADDQGGVS